MCQERSHVGRYGLGSEVPGHKWSFCRGDISRLRNRGKENRSDYRLWIFLEDENGRNIRKELKEGVAIMVKDRMSQSDVYIEIDLRC